MSHKKRICREQERKKNDYAAVIFAEKGPSKQMHKARRERIRRGGHRNENQK
jgi:hypothetical protein